MIFPFTWLLLDIADAQRFATAMGRCEALLRAKLKRRGLRDQSPGFLGLPGDRWNDDLLEELTGDAFLSAFSGRMLMLARALVERVRKSGETALKPPQDQPHAPLAERVAGVLAELPEDFQPGAESNIDGAVSRNIDSFLTVLQKRHNPIRYAVFKNLEQCALAMRETRRAAWEPPDAPPRNATVVRLSNEGSEPASEDALRTAVTAGRDLREWLDVLSERGRAGLDATQALLDRLDRDGPRVWRLGDLHGVLTRLVEAWSRQPFSARAVAAEQNEDGEIAFVPIEGPDPLLLARDEVAAHRRRLRILVVCTKRANGRPRALAVLERWAMGETNHQTIATVLGQAAGTVYDDIQDLFGLLRDRRFLTVAAMTRGLERLPGGVAERNRTKRFWQDLLDWADRPAPTPGDARLGELADLIDDQPAAFDRLRELPGFLVTELRLQLRVVERWLAAAPSHASSALAARLAHDQENAAARLLAEARAASAESDALVVANRVAGDFDDVPGAACRLAAACGEIATT